MIKEIHKNKGGLLIYLLCSVGRAIDVNELNKFIPEDKEKVINKIRENINL